MIIAITCPICGDTNYVSVQSEDWYAYVNGELVQNAFPYLSPDDTELLISGICPTCWTDTFGEDDDE